MIFAPLPSLHGPPRAATGAPSINARKNLCLAAPIEELRDAVDLTVVLAVRKGEQLVQEPPSQLLLLGKWTWPASIVADCAAMRFALLSSGLRPIDAACLPATRGAASA